MFAYTTTTMVNTQTSLGYCVWFTSSSIAYSPDFILKDESGPCCAGAYFLLGLIFTNKLRKKVPYCTETCLLSYVSSRALGIICTYRITVKLCQRLCMEVTGREEAKETSLVPSPTPSFLSPLYRTASDEMLGVGLGTRLQRDSLTSSLIVSK